MTDTQKQTYKINRITRGGVKKKEGKSDYFLDLNGSKISLHTARKISVNSNVT